MDESSRAQRLRAGKPGGPNVTAVAREAGVSIATVSRVINMPDVVAPSTRARVQQAMDALNYRVNPAASALRRGHGKVITVLVASISQPWYTKLMRELKQEIDARGFNMMQYDLQHDPEALMAYLEPDKQQLQTGIILATGDSLAGEATRDALRRAHEARPLVVIGENVADATWPTIQFEDEGGAYEATKALLRGDGPVAFLGELAGSYLADERLRGYLRAHAEAGRDPAGWIWPIASRGYEAGLVEVLARIDAGQMPGAILAINDELALGASRAVLTSGRRIPEDVQIMGYGNTDFLDYTTPTLSSVDGSAVDAARLAVEALWAQLRGEAAEPLTVLGRRLVERESTSLRHRSRSAT